MLKSYNRDLVGWDGLEISEHPSAIRALRCAAQNSFQIFTFSTSLLSIENVISVSIAQAMNQIKKQKACFKNSISEYWF